jgi:hypothetical protein
MLKADEEHGLQEHRQKNSPLRFFSDHRKKSMVDENLTVRKLENLTRFFRTE